MFDNSHIRLSLTRGKKVLLSLTYHFSELNNFLKIIIRQILFHHHSHGSAQHYMGAGS